MKLNEGLRSSLVKNVVLVEFSSYWFFNKKMGEGGFPVRI